MMKTQVQNSGMTRSEASFERAEGKAVVAEVSPFSLPLMLCTAAVTAARSFGCRPSFERSATTDTQNSLHCVNNKYKFWESPSPSIQISQVVQRISKRIKHATLRASCTFQLSCK